MAETKKNEVAETGKQQASLVVNNAFVDGLVKQLAQKEQLGLTFPKDYNYSNELMGAYLILKETVDSNKKPVLESCTQISIANTLMDMVTMGLSMQKKQCYPVAYGGKLQCQVSVYGNTCVARRYGLDKISAMVIYKNDTFEYHIEDGEIVIDTHKQDFLNIDTDNIIGAYAIAKMNDGSKHVELMNMSMIKKAWSQGFGYKENGNGTHQKFTDQMAIKTVKNRCLKFIIRTYGTQAMSDYLDVAEARESDDRVAMDVEHEIAENANKTEFEPIDVDSKEVVDEPTGEPKQADIADFLND
jgi:recombination protein RecT